MKTQNGLDLFISPITGRFRVLPSFPLEEGQIIIGNEDNVSVPSLLLKDLLIEFIRLKKNLAVSTVILQKPSGILGKGQALNELEDGLLKHHEGVIERAIPDEDYVTEETLQEYVDQARQAAEDAQAAAQAAQQSAQDAMQYAQDADQARLLASISASEAAVSASTATTAAASAVQSAAASATSAAAAAGSALLAAGFASSASSSAEDARDYRDEALSYRDQALQHATDAYNYLQQLLNIGVTFVNDVIGGGPLKDPIPLELALRLNEIKKPVGDVDMNQHSIINLETLEASTWEELESKAQHGINFLFLWKLFGGEVRENVA